MRTKRISKTAPKQRSTRAKTPDVRRALTVLIHGSLNQHAMWYQSGGLLYEFLQNEVYRGEALLPFQWSGGMMPQEFATAASDLIAAVQQREPLDMLRIVCHSNGANVANLATRPGIIPLHPGLKPCTIVYMSPSARREFLPHLPNILSQRVFNFRPRLFDEILDPLGLPKTYTGTPLGTLEEEVFVGPTGHWTPIWPIVWRTHSLKQRVRQVCR